MRESPIPQAQAAANDPDQFANSPVLPDELIKALIGSMAVHQEMSKQALNSEAVQAQLLKAILGPGQLWQNLRGQGPLGFSAP
jgi:type I restriction enzyme R subunit